MRATVETTINGGEPLIMTGVIRKRKNTLRVTDSKGMYLDIQPGDKVTYLPPKKRETRQPIKSNLLFQTVN
jgi:hypothetical protein